MNVKKYFSLTRAGLIETLQFRIALIVMVFGNLLYLTLIYFVWKAIFASAGTDVVNGMTFETTMIYLVLATALFNFMELYIVWDIHRDVQNGAIAIKLIKPMRYKDYMFWSVSGAFVGNFVFTFLPTFLVVLFVTKQSISADNPESIKAVYEKLTQKLYFSTPIGMNFLMEMREYLVTIYGEEILPVPVAPARITRAARGRTVDIEKYKQLKKENSKAIRIKNNLTIAVIAMLITIIGILFILITNENSGFFRAEEKLVNKYSAWEERLYNWEQELNEREAEISQF